MSRSTPDDGSTPADGTESLLPSSVVAMLSDFADGSLEPVDFAAALVSDPRLQEWLDAAEQPEYTHSSAGLYYYLVGMDLARLDQLGDARAAVADALVAAGIDVTADASEMEFVAAVAGAAPPWLDGPSHYLAVLRADAPDGDSGTLRAILRDRFRFDDRPPRWLQDCCWPLIDGEPAIFVRQDPVAGHDVSASFTFRSRDGRTVVVTQRC